MNFTTIGKEMDWKVTIKPKCMECGKPMENYIPNKGRFKGKVQKYSWVCKCNKLVISIG